MLFDAGDNIARVPQIGPLAYVALVVLVRLSGKPTLAKMNAFDLVVTVAPGSTLVTIALSSDVSASEGVAVFLALVAAQWPVAQASVRWRAARRLAKAEPAASRRA